MTVQQIAARVAGQAAQSRAGPPGAGLPEPPGGFAEALARAAGPPRLSVSAHAEARLSARGIDLSAPVRARIDAALDTLSAKGAREAVLVGEGAAFIVSVPNRTLVTALAPGELTDRVVTQIDAAAFL